MGYGYGMNNSGRYVLACDNCGGIGSVRKRTCPYKVLGDSSRGARFALPYCPAPAVCPECWIKIGGNAGAHGERCRDGAASSQREADATQSRLDAGELMVLSASGDWAEWVPAGMVGVTFGNGARERVVLMPAELYGHPRPDWLSEYPADRLELVRDNGAPIVPWQAPTPRAKVRDGDVLTFAHPMRFTRGAGNSQAFSRFRAVQDGRKWRFLALEEESDAVVFRCQITGWQKRAYTVEPAGA
jgi:hypothetical protein